MLNVRYGRRMRRARGRYRVASKPYLENISQGLLSTLSRLEKFAKRGGDPTLLDTRDNEKLFDKAVRESADWYEDAFGVRPDTDYRSLHRLRDAFGLPTGSGVLDEYSSLAEGWLLILNKIYSNAYWQKDGPVENVNMSDVFNAEARISQLRRRLDQGMEELER